MARKTRIGLGGTRAPGTQEIAPINVKLASLVGQYGSGWTSLTAGAFITIALPLVVFFSLQRYFVRGLLAGSVK
jgi:alpha-glucoside transport system permease protein